MKMNVLTIRNLLFGLCSLLLVKCEQDFNFNDETQFSSLEPQEEPSTIAPFKNPYTIELSQCPFTEDKVVLTLILKSKDWKDLIENKRTKVLNKLSKFFAIPKESIAFDSLTKNEFLDISKNSIRRGPHKYDTNKSLGRLDITIGCGRKYFSTGGLISKQIGHQMADGSIDDIAGIEFGSWLIWRKKRSNRVQRYRRQVEGSGEEEYEYEYDDEDRDDDVDESSTEIPQVTTHAHRHHHGVNKVNTTTSLPPDEEFSSTLPILVETDETENSTLKSTDASNVFTTTNTTLLITTSTESTTIPSTTIKASDILPNTTTVRATTTPITSTTTEYIERKQENTPPFIKSRLKKLQATAGKLFEYKLPVETFDDKETPGVFLVQLLDKQGNNLPENSWIQYDPYLWKIYALPLEDTVSRWQYKLTATDPGNKTVAETVDITVQQHKGHRSVNHEITVGLKIANYTNTLLHQIYILEDIVNAMGDKSPSAIVVREVRQSQLDPRSVTFIYTNETLPKNECPEKELNEIVKRLNEKLAKPYYQITSITGQMVGPCLKHNMPKPKPTSYIAKNYPPVPRNQVDRVNATVGHLLVYKVPADTFYDPNDTTDLKLSLLTGDRKELSARHWLQFDSKNQEFYGIPKSGDIGSEDYLLVAEDSGGLTATDALVVIVSHAPKRDFSVYFKAYLGIRHEQFNTDLQRKFVERIAQLFGDHTTQHIQVRSITTHHDSDGSIVNFYNTTLYKSHNHCPEEEIDAVKYIYFHQDNLLRDHVKKIVGSEFNLTNVQMVPLGSCHPIIPDVTHRDVVPIKTEDPKSTSTVSDYYLYTFILPAVIIVIMIVLASLIACFLHRRHLTGKMELGDEEERKSFRSKGIPVIFQDELDEKPEIGNKSPIILKNEKPPLLPPYNSSNMEGDNDVDEYVPPPAVVVGGREARGKSPVTPSYRKPPPYVSP